MHPGHVSSPRFAFERQSLSFCIFCCDTNLTIAPYTVPVFNYHFKRLKVFAGFYMVWQTVLKFRSKDSQTFASKGNLYMLCTGIFKFNIYFSQTSLIVSFQLKKSLIKLGVSSVINFGTQYS